MKKIILVLAASLLLILASCLKNENSIIFSDYVELSASALPDTVQVNSAIPITLVATAENACWHSLGFLQGIVSDTIVTYAAYGTFENHGEVCEDVIVTKDTLTHFVPTKVKNYIFRFVVAADSVRIDTVVVKI